MDPSTRSIVSKMVVGVAIGSVILSYFYFQSDDDQNLIENRKEENEKEKEKEEKKEDILNPQPPAHKKTQHSTHMALN